MARSTLPIEFSLGNDVKLLSFEVVLSASLSQCRVEKIFSALQGTRKLLSERSTLRQWSRLNGVEVSDIVKAATDSQYESQQASLKIERLIFGTSSGGAPKVLLREGETSSHGKWMHGRLEITSRGCCYVPWHRFVDVSVWDGIISVSASTKTDFSLAVDQI